MKNKPKKSLIIITLISIFLCGCPGCFLLFEGAQRFSSAIGPFDSFEDISQGFATGLLNGGWMVCLSGFFIMIPTIFALVAVFARDKKDELEAIEPTGVSKEEPIPPPS